VTGDGGRNLETRSGQRSVSFLFYQEVIGFKFIFPVCLRCRLKYSSGQGTRNDQIMIWIAPSEKDTATGTLEKRLGVDAELVGGNPGLTQVRGGSL